MFDVEKLICEVEKRWPLYNITLKDYSNRELKAKCWMEICAEMYPTGMKWQMRSKTRKVCK